MNLYNFALDKKHLQSLDYKISSNNKYAGSNNVIQDNFNLLKEIANLYEVPDYIPKRTIDVGAVLLNVVSGVLLATVSPVGVFASPVGKKMTDIDLKTFKKEFNKGISILYRFFNTDYNNDKDIEAIRKKYKNKFIKWFDNYQKIDYDSLEEGRKLSNELKPILTGVQYDIAELLGDPNLLKKLYNSAKVRKIEETKNKLEKKLEIELSKNPDKKEKIMNKFNKKLDYYRNQLMMLDEQRGGALNFDAKSLAKKIGKGALIAGGVTAGLGAAGLTGLGLGGMTMAEVPGFLDKRLDRLKDELNYLQEKGSISSESAKIYIDRIEDLEDRLESIDFIKGNGQSNLHELASINKEVEGYWKTLIN